MASSNPYCYGISVEQKNSYFINRGSGRSNPYCYGISVEHERGNN